MPKLLFHPKSHQIGEEESLFVTCCESGDPVVCIRCNDVAAYILSLMYPESCRKPDLIEAVQTHFQCTLEEAQTAVITVLNALQNREETNDGE